MCIFPKLNQIQHEIVHKPPYRFLFDSDSQIKGLYSWMDAPYTIHKH